MEKYPVNFKFRAKFDLMPSWLPKVLRNWLELGWAYVNPKRAKR